MFECRACLRRVWRTILHDLDSYSPLVGLSNHAAIPSRLRVTPAHRWHSTAPVRLSQEDRTYNTARSNTPRKPRTKQVARRHPAAGRTTIRAGQRTIHEELLDQRRSLLLKSRQLASLQDEDDSADAPTREQRDGALTPVQERKMARAMKFLTDPLKFSNHINDLLEKRRNEEAALKLVRYASKSRQCVVAWNHIIQWHLAHGKPNAAIKLYNEMKKRGQWPDSYTYMHLIGGLGKQWHHPTMLSKALSIYHSMSAENSRVKPRTLHTNVALKACAHAGDMDALWGVASRLSDKGPQSADGITYSIILNALRRQALEDMDTQETSVTALVHYFDRAVLTGCRLWGEVVTKWRKGDLVMDDALVCAMARLLLVSYRPKVWDAVFSLVESTENLKRVSPVVHDSSVSKHLPALTAPRDRVNVSEDGTVVKSGTTSSEDADGLAQLDQFTAMLTTDSQPGDAFDRANANLVFAQPTNRTLSLLMETCQKLVNKKAADAYWNLLVNDHKFKLKPDGDNFHSYLRVLRQHHSSTQVIRLIKHQMDPKLMAPKTFRIAIGACLTSNSKDRSAAVDHCAEVVDLMIQHMDAAQAGTLIAYVSCAKVTQDIPALVKTLRHVDQIMQDQGEKLFPSEVDEIKLLSNQNQQAMRDLIQLLKDSVAWLEGQMEFTEKSQPAWRALRQRIVRASNLLSRAGLAVKSTGAGQPPKGAPRERLRTVNVNARNVRRKLAEQAEKSQPDHGLAELPFEATI